jgi:hypothetical protein
MKNFNFLFFLAYSQKKTVIPVLLRDSRTILPDKMKFIFSNIQWINFETIAYREAFKDLLRVCDQLRIDSSFGKPHGQAQNLNTAQQSPHTIIVSSNVSPQTS